MDAHTHQHNADQMPPREHFRSGEWLAVQQEIAAAVDKSLQGQREGIRQDLREFRDEIKNDVGGLRKEVSEMRLGMVQGDGMFKLLNQRMTWLEGEHEKREQLEQSRLRNAHLTDTSRISRILADAKTGKPPSERPSDSDRPKLLINPKVINAAILAFAAAGGASLWALLEHALSPTAPAAPVPPTEIAPSTHATLHVPPPGQ